MNTLAYRLIGFSAAALLLAACSQDRTSLASTGPAAPVRTNVAMSQGTLTGLSASLLGPMLDGADSGGGHFPMFGGHLSRSNVDSLTVDVTKVEVLAATPDSENAADSASEHADSSHEDEDDHEEDERTWVQLDVTGNGHINLLKLPDSASAGIEVASGMLAPGTYRHVRLFVTNATIYLDTTIVTPAGDTLKKGVGIPVKIPSADSTGAAVKTDESFTVPQGGGTVKLFFDADDTIRRIVVTGNGTIIVPPVIGDHWWGGRDH